MATNSAIRRAVRYALLTGAITAASAAAPAYSQDQEQDAGPDAMGTVVVTGSRIRMRDFEAISPITTVSSETIQATGNLNIEEVLNSLPQIVPGFNANSNNPSDGTATVDLRGIGPTRTLVLINGRRLTPSTQTGRTDLNNIPSRLIERVEVVTGGASAVYGSDALAGVVNFILKDNFEGFDIGVQSGQSAESDGTENQVDLVLGGNFADDRGNITAFASYYDREQVLQSEREYTRVDRGSNGSATGNARLPNVALNPFPTANTFLGSGGNTRNYAFNLNNNGGVRTWNNTLPESSADGLGDRYNFAPVNNLLTPGQRVHIGALAKLDLAENIQAYADLMYIDSQNGAQLAPTPAVNVAFDPDSPGLSAQARALLDARPNPNAPAFITRRMIEVGARVQENKSKLQQIAVGFKGGLPIKDWAYDVSYQYGENEFINVTFNDVSASKFGAALSGCPADYVQFVPDCVPISAFGVGSITAQQANFVRLNFTDTQIFERNLVTASVDGSLFDMPAGPLGFAFGAEWRKDETSFRPDIAKQSGDILGFNAQQPIAGDFDVYEIFLETVIPLARDIPGISSLSLEAGGRYSDYSSVGAVTSYKGGLDWAPVDSLHVRGMYQRAVRAPSVFELFQAGDQGFPTATDPCSSVSVATGAPTPVPADVAAFCQAAFGIDASTYVQTNGQLESFFFGNPNLAEETSDTVTFGLAWTPDAVEGLQASLDYWNIEVADYVNSLEGGATGVINACFATLDINSSACFSGDLGQALIFRDAVGDLKVRVPVANLSSLEAAGVDLHIAYRVPIGNTLTTDLLVTYLDKWVLDDIDYAGTTGAYNILNTLPEYKANLRLAYPFGPVAVTYNAQWIDKMDNQGNIPAFQDGGYEGPKSILYHDLAGSWQINDSLELSAGVRNLTDEEPPFFTFPIDQNTDPATYDMLGRFYFASLRATF